MKHTTDKFKVEGFCFEILKGEEKRGGSTVKKLVMKQFDGELCSTTL